MFLGSSKPCAFEKNICFRFSFFCKKKKLREFSSWVSNSGNRYKQNICLLNFSSFVVFFSLLFPYIIFLITVKENPMSSPNDFRMLFEFVNTKFYASISHPGKTTYLNRDPQWKCTGFYADPYKKFMFSNSIISPVSNFSTIYLTELTHEFSFAG